MDSSRQLRQGTGRRRLRQLRPEVQKRKAHQDGHCDLRLRGWISQGMLGKRICADSRPEGKNPWKSLHGPACCRYQRD